MPMTENTRWIVGTGIVLFLAIVGSVYTGVSYLTGSQTAMENRLSGNITGAENRLTKRIDQVVGRLETVDSRLGSVEQKTAVLAGIEDRLSQQVTTAENRLAADIRNVEDRLIAHIDKLDGRLGAVEQRTTSLAGIVQSRWSPTIGIWPKDKGSIVKAGPGQGAFDAKMLERMKEAGIHAEYFLTPVPYLHFGANEVVMQEIIKALQEAGQAPEDAEDPAVAPAPSAESG